ncbi:MAG TPA: DUF6680 family protein [Roseiarcus sp.]|nr:DUF6680 family protein [Roseiarcus sp.]
MTDYYSLAAAFFSALATAFAAFATWYAPRAAAKLAESLRRDAEKSQERQRNKLHVFASLMQERSAIYSEAGVRALNIIDVVFHDSRPVREAWAELFLAFSLKPLPDHVLEERLRKLLAAMAEDIGLGDKLRTDDFGRVYSPTAITQDRFIRDMQRQQAIAALSKEQSPATNSAESSTSLWPPKPE